MGFSDALWALLIQTWLEEFESSDLQSARPNLPTILKKLREESKNWSPVRVPLDTSAQAEQADSTSSIPPELTHPWLNRSSQPRVLSPAPTLWPKKFQSIRSRQMTISAIWKTFQGRRSTPRNSSTAWIGYVLSICSYMQRINCCPTPVNRYPGAWVKNLPQKFASPAKDLRNLRAPPNFTPHFGAAKLSDCRSNETPVRLQWLF